MGIPKKTYSAIEKRVFQEIETTGVDSDTMHMVIAFDIVDNSNKSLVLTIKLSPAPPMEAWDKIFANVAKEVYGDVHRIPLYVAIMTKIRYSRKDISDEYLSDGFFLIVVGVESGAGESRLYKMDFSLEQGSIKKFSIFNVDEIRKFPPAMPLLSFVVHMMIEESLSPLSEPVLLDDIPDQKMLGMTLNRDRETGDIIAVTSVDYFGDEDSDGEKIQYSPN